MTRPLRTTLTEKCAMGASLLALIALLPRAARADAGVPMLASLWPSAWLLLLPVWLVKGLVAKRVLRLSWARSAELSLIAGAWSFLVGFPLAFIGLAFVERMLGIVASLLGFDDGWLNYSGPFFKLRHLPGVRHWHVFVAAAALCVPLFFVSVRVESWSARERVAPDQAGRWALRANVASSASIVAVLIVLAVVSGLQGK